MRASRWSSPGATTREGADEITFLDVSAGGAPTTYEVVRGPRTQVFVPLTVGGGVRRGGRRRPAAAGARDKVGVNTAAIARPALIAEIARRFGRQVLVLSVDACRVPRAGRTRATR